MPLSLSNDWIQLYFFETQSTKQYSIIIKNLYEYKAIIIYQNQYRVMKTVKQFILQCDIFAHKSLQRYKEEQAYRTFAGGIISLIIICLFTIIFSNLIIQTFEKNIIVSQTSITYDDDPTHSQIITNPAHNHMFAIGLSNIDLRDSQRYFDVAMIKHYWRKNGTGTIRTNQTIPLEPCALNHWSGMGASIQKNFDKLNFKTWLCPPLNTQIPLQGKFTSTFFRFAQILVGKCTNNTLFPNTTCRTTADIQNFLISQGQFIFNFYFVNTVINPNVENFISNYLQDRNYFAFDTTLGVEANLFYTDYNVQTDTTFLPWQEYEDTAGCLASETAKSQNFQVGTKDYYLKFHLRKAADNLLISRSFQKVDQTFSYIGGLFGTITLLLSFMHLYSKYTYELDLGDKLLKKNNGGSFGSQNFNFIVFIGYLLFNIFTKFAVILNWKTMKKYHQCRMECQKQLNIDLLFKKIMHFQEITRIVLEDYQLKMLLMTPKPTIKEAKINRKRYLIKNIIYYHLEQKAGDIHVQKTELKQRLKQFLRQQGNQNMRQVMEEEKHQNSMKLIQEDIIRSYKKLKSEKSEYAYSNKKIIERINIEDMTEAIINFITTDMEHKIHNTIQAQGEITSQCLNPILKPQIIDILPITQPLQISQFSHHEHKENQQYNLQNGNYHLQEL